MSRELEEEAEATIAVACKRNGTTREKLAREIGKDDPQSIIVALNVLDYGRNVAEDRERLAQSMEAAKVMIREANAHGLPKAFIARAAGVTRQTVYDVIAGPEPFSAGHAPGNVAAYDLLPKRKKP